jgi:hypothetical protein
MIAQPAIAGRSKEKRVSEEEGGSILGGLAEAAESYVDMTANLGGAAVDIGQAYGQDVMAAIGHVDAGFVRAVGADDVADRIDRGADGSEQDARNNIAEASQELSQAGEDIWGG